jgi:hypothetical protein
MTDEFKLRRWTEEICRHFAEVGEISAFRHVVDRARHHRAEIKRSDKSLDERCDAAAREAYTRCLQALVE